MTPLQIALIVEGHGEVLAVPKLLKRIAREVVPERYLADLPPLRLPAGKMKKASDELERMVELAAANTERQGAILILVDADDDCPATLGPALVQHAHKVCSDLPIAAVVAKSEYEGWFLASVDQLCFSGMLPAGTQAPPNPESVRGAKEWLTRALGRKYNETIDQLAFTNDFDMVAARANAPSFDKFYRDVERLLQTLVGK